MRFLRRILSSTQSIRYVQILNTNKKYYLLEHVSFRKSSQRNLPQAAMVAALTDMVPEAEIETKTLTLMVVGAGRCHPWAPSSIVSLLNIESVSNLCLKGTPGPGSTERQSEEWKKDQSVRRGEEPKRCGDSATAAARGLGRQGGLL